MCEVEVMKKFVRDHAKGMYMFSAWLVTLTVLIVNIVAYAVTPITFNNTIQMLAVSTFTVMLAISHFHFKPVVKNFRFFEDPFYKGTYMIL